MSCYVSIPHIDTQVWKTEFSEQGFGPLHYKSAAFLFRLDDLHLVSHLHRSLNCIWQLACSIQLLPFFPLFILAFRWFLGIYSLLTLEHLISMVGTLS